MLLLLALFCSWVTAIPEETASADNSNKSKDDKSAEPTRTVAPIFLPHYSKDQWDLLRGSIIGSDEKASETTYTIFCPTETPPACDLSLDFPFVIVGGPESVKFHGTVTSTYTANVECELEGTTAATCSGYSSYGDDYRNGHYTGPSEVEWTSTLTGSAVEWGSLTLAGDPKATDDSSSDDAATTASPLFESSGDLYYIPEPTSAEGGAAVVSGTGWVMVCGLVVGLWSTVMA